MFRIIIVSLIFTAVTVSKGENVRIATFLSTVNEDSSLMNQTKTIKSLQKSSVRFPIIDEIEFKMGSAAPFSPNYSWSQRQRYSARITPNGIGETFMAGKVYKISLDYNIHKKEMLLNSFLKKRYLIISELLYGKTILKRSLEHKILLEDRIAVLEKMSTLEDFDFTDLVKAQKDFSKLNLEIIEHKNLVDISENHFRAIMPLIGDIELDTIGLIEINAIKDLINKSSLNIDNENVYLKESVLKMDAAQSLYKLESKDNRRILSFLEFGFDADKYADEKADKIKNKGNKDKYEFNKAFNMELGLTLPIRGLSRIDDNKRMLKMVEEQEEYSSNKEELEEIARILQGEIHTLVEQYNFLADRRKEMNPESVLNKYMALDGEDPLVLLKIKENINENETMLEEVKFLIYGKYIEVMDITGRLCEKPLRNYLSNTMEEIQ
jgi:hypothetical protein